MITNKVYQTVLELCNMRDGVSHCEYLNSDEIYKLLFSICTCIYL